eukprot:1156901-Pelagomonas_calceolata.AAC.1
MLVLQRKSYASGSHLKRYIKEGQTPIATRDRTQIRRLVLQKERKERKTMWAEETLPTPIKEKETHWLKRAGSLLHCKAIEERVLMGIWRVTGHIAADFYWILVGVIPSLN